MCLSAAQYSPVQPRPPRTAHYIPVHPSTAQYSQILYQIMNKTAPNHQLYCLEIMRGFHPNYLANIVQYNDNQCHLKSVAKIEEIARFLL